MSNYDTIKDEALKFMTRDKMNSVRYSKEEYAEYFEEALHLMLDVLGLIDKYPDEFASYVVAYNIVGSNTRQIADMTDKVGMDFYALVALTYKVRLLEKSVVFLGSGIKNDKCAEFLLLELTQSFLISLTTWSKQADETKAKDMLMKIVLRFVNLCANVYQVALSFHPSLTSAKAMWDLFDKTVGHADEMLTPTENLRPRQMQEACCELDQEIGKVISVMYESR